MNLPFIDRIWVARGSFEFDQQLDACEAFDRLAPLFDREEVELDSQTSTLTYRKANPEAQHKLATFSSGTLEFQCRGNTSEITYRVRSPALLLTFLAPLLFLAFGQTIVGIGMVNQALTVEEEKEDEEEKEPSELHWIDEMLGAPAPENPEEKEDKDEGEEEEDEDHSPMQSYGLAGVFALIYLIGRILEPRLFRSTLRNALAGDAQNASVGLES